MLVLPGAAEAVRCAVLGTCSGMVCAPTSHERVVLPALLSTKSLCSEFLASSLFLRYVEVRFEQIYRLMGIVVHGDACSSVQLLCPFCTDESFDAA